MSVTDSGGWGSPPPRFFLLVNLKIPTDVPFWGPWHEPPSRIPGSATVCIQDIALYTTYHPNDHTHEPMHSELINLLIRLIDNNL